MLVEIGGTVGDIESLPFLEAIRQFRQDVGRENTLYIHLTLVPFIGTAGELKTKPTQHSVRDLRSIGIQPDILLCRTDRFLDPRHQAEDRAVLRRRRGGGHHRQGRRRRSTKCRSCCAAEGLDRIVLKHARPAADRGAHGGRGRSSSSASRPDDEVTIHVVGKYIGYEDSYKSLNEALYHGGFAHRAARSTSSGSRPRRWNSEGGARLLDGADGILVPGGFGIRGTRGMMKAAEIARERGIPYFGICYGFQWATVEYARNVCGLDGRRLDRSATRRAAQGDLQAARPARRRRPRRHDAARPLRLRAGAGLAGRNGSTAPTLIHERHRHRYEFNCLYEPALDREGHADLGRSPDGKFVEIAELPGHPWYIAVQFHPEFQSQAAASRIRCSPASSRPRYRHEARQRAARRQPSARRDERCRDAAVDAASRSGP